MKNIFLFLSFLILHSQSEAQIKFEKSYESALEISRLSGKPMAVLITIQPPAGTVNFLSGLKDPKVVEIMNSSFVNFRIDRSEEASSDIIKKFSIVRFPSFIILDSKGGLITQTVASMPPPFLIPSLEQALSESKGVSLVELDEQYKSGDRSRAFLRSYIERRMKTGIFNNAEMIESYVNSLQVSELDNYNQVLFILKSGPWVDGRAYKLAWTNRRIVDSIFKTEIYDVRTAINNNIINNTMDAAINARNANQASAAANLSRQTWGTNHAQGYKSYGSRMLQYYRAIKDTTRYLPQAVSFYEQHYMRITADSIRRKDRENLEAARSRSNQAAFGNAPPTSVTTVSFQASGSTFATELNNAAYAIFQTGTRNPIYLNPAINWSKRAIELQPISGFYDTLAHLLYRQGYFLEAQSTQEKAVELAKSEKRNVSLMQEKLIKIKKRQL